MKARFAKLIDVKTIVTFALTGAFVWLSLKGEVKPDVFLTIYSTIIGWYFASQGRKTEEAENDKGKRKLD